MDIFKRQKMNRVQQIPIKSIAPNPRQPRKVFKEKDLDSLAQSIEKLGILQPLTVRKVDEGWELIAGERRLRASQIAGLTVVPCLVKEVGEEDSALLALVENIQRENLDYLEEAQALSKVIQQYGLSQEELSRQLGRSQSAVANTLRLLRHSEAVQEALRASSCTQRHARALLKLPEEGHRLAMIEKITELNLTVSQTEEYIQRFLEPPTPPSQFTSQTTVQYTAPIPPHTTSQIQVSTQPPLPLGTQGPSCGMQSATQFPPQSTQTTATQKRGKEILIIRDVRLFLNSIKKAVDLMQSAGVNADYQKVEYEKEIVLTIKIPRQVAVNRRRDQKQENLVNSGETAVPITK